MTHTARQPQMLLCPVCQFDYMRITSAGISWHKSSRAPLIKFSFECEDGHRGEARIEFHKGQTFVELNPGSMRVTV